MNQSYQNWAPRVQDAAHGQAPGRVVLGGSAATGEALGRVVGGGGAARGEAAGRVMVDEGGYELRPTTVRCVDLCLLGGGRGSVGRCCLFVVSLYTSLRSTPPRTFIVIV